MKHIFFGLILFASIFSQNIAAQGDFNNVQVRISPLSLLDPLTSSIHIGIQTDLFKRIAFSIDYGHKFTPTQLLNWNDNKFNRRYFEIRSEVKFFLEKRSQSATALPYVSVEAFYIPHHYRKYNGWINKGEDLFFYSYADISNVVKGGALKIGMENKIGSKFLIDFYTGFGIRQVTVDHDAYDLVRIEEYDRYFRSDKIEGIVNKPHLSFGFKVGYLIYSR
jgi:hypothetical protein